MRHILEQSAVNSGLMNLRTARTSTLWDLKKTLDDNKITLTSHKPECVVPTKSLLKNELDKCDTANDTCLQTCVSETPVVSQCVPETPQNLNNDSEHSAVIQEPMEDTSTKGSSNSPIRVANVFFNNLQQLNNEFKEENRLQVERKVIRRALEFDADYSQDDLSSFDEFLVECESNIDKLRSRIRQATTHHLDTLSKRSARDCDMLDKKLINHKTLSQWEAFRATVRSQIYSIESDIFN